MGIAVAEGRLTKVDEADQPGPARANTPAPSQGDVLCRDVGFADDYFMHSVSVYYYGESWTLGAGIRNVFDESPPLVNGDEVSVSVRNLPLGYGYDLNGRTFYLNVAASFGGTGR